MVPDKSRTEVGALSIDSNLLDIICCPVTRLPMEVMSEAMLRGVNLRIGDLKLVSRDGTVLTEELQQALITRDGKLAYPVQDGIPVLLEDCVIVLSQLEGV